MIKFKSAVATADLNAYKAKVSKAHDKLHSDKLAFTSWINWPESYDKKEFNNIEKVAKKLRSEIDILVVCGVGGSYLGAKAAIDFLSATTKNSKEVIFIGNSLSARDLKTKLDYLKGKEFAVNVISKSGTTTETAIAFRLVREMMIKTYGVAKTNKRIMATTDASKGALKEMATKNKWTTFNIHENIGGRYSVLTAVGLLPMAVAGINISKVLTGAFLAMEDTAKDSLSNPAYKYAVSRNILGKKVNNEVLVSFESSLAPFQEWWKQLFGESEGKKKKGIFPASMVFSTDLHSLGQFIQDGKPVLFETFINFKTEKVKLKLKKDKANLDNLNYLCAMNIDEINNVAYKATMKAHKGAGVKINTIELESQDEHALGYMFYFMMKSCAMSAMLMGVNPFDQPGVEVYKRNMFKLLKKPA